jgi:hypothetical protein
MNRTTCRWIKLACAFAVIGLGLNVVACSDQSNKRPLTGPMTTAAGITNSSAMITPQGPFARGTVTSVQDPATIGPVFSLISPARAAHITAGSVTVQFEVLDIDGVASVEIGGLPATQVGGSDIYQASVPLTLGLNSILVEATDAVGNTTYSYTSVVQGLFVPDDQVSTTNVAVSLTQDGLVRLDDVIESQLGAIDLNGLVAGGRRVLNTALLDVDVTGIRHMGMAPTTNGAPNGITLIIDIADLEVDATADLIGLQVVRATLGAALARATIHATVDRSLIPPNTPTAQALGLQVDQIDIDLTGFDIRNGSAIANLLSPFSGSLERAVENALEGAIVDLVDQALAGSIVAIDSPAVISMPGIGAGTGALGLQVEIDHANGVPGFGLDILGGAKISHQGVIRPGASREVFVRGTPAQVVPATAGDQFAITLSADILNALLHSAQIQDALQFEIDGTQPYPVGSTPMSVSFLYPFIPVARELAPDPNTPIVIEARLMSDPIVDFPSFDPTIQLQAGEIEVTLSIDYMDGGARAELFTLRAALAIEGTVDVAINQVRLAKLKANQALVDVIREPSADVNDHEIERFFNAAVPFLVDEFAAKAVPPIMIPALPLGLQLTNPRLEAAPGFLTVRGGL